MYSQNNQDTSHTNTRPLHDALPTYNGLSFKWEAKTINSGTVTSITATTGLNGGVITGTGTVSVDVCTDATKILQVTTGRQYPALDGNIISNVNAFNIRGSNISATVP